MSVLRHAGLADLFLANVERRLLVLGQTHEMLNVSFGLPQDS